jgi:hypothetical protein
MSAGEHRWFDHLPAVTAEVDCGNARHRITWRRARLVLEDHDVLAERALVALGGEPPLCLQTLDAWRRPALAAGMLQRLLLDDNMLDEAELMARRLRYETAIVNAKEDWPRPIPAAVAAQVGAMRQADLEREQRMWSVTLIESLPPQLRRRMALAAIVHLARSPRDAEDLRTARASLDFTLSHVAIPLFERSVRRWIRNLKSYAGVVVQARSAAHGQPPGCTAHIDHSGAQATLALPPTWFTDIWAPGIALVDDCFVLRRASRAGDASSAHVIAIRFERTSRDVSRAVQEPAIVTRGANGEWSLRWL